MRKLLPDQAVEEVVQAVARGHAAGVVDELLVGHAGGQIGLGHETHGGRAGHVERLVAAMPGEHLQCQGFAQRPARRQPGRLPVDVRQPGAHPARAALPCRLSRTATWEVPSWASSNSCEAASSLVSVE